MYLLTLYFCTQLKSYYDANKSIVSEFYYQLLDRGRSLPCQTCDGNAIVWSEL